MYNEQIKEILMKTYDVCAYTLDCGSSAVREKKLYYYTLDKDYEKEIFLLRNVLESQLSKNSIGCLNELINMLAGQLRLFKRNSEKHKEVFSSLTKHTLSSMTETGLSVMKPLTRLFRKWKTTVMMLLSSSQVILIRWKVFSEESRTQIQNCLSCSVQ